MAKKILKVSSLLLLVFVVIAGAFAYHEWNYKPLFINNFFNRSVLKMALESPEILTNLRVLEQFGIDGHNKKLDDASLEKSEQLFARVAKMQETLRSYQDDELSNSELISKKVADELMTYFIDSKEFQFYNYPLNQIWGIQLNLPTFLATKHVIANEEDAENYLLRLESVPKKISQTMEGLVVREEQNLLPPKFVATKVIAGLDKFINTPAKENILCKSFAERMEKTEQSINKVQQDEFQSRCADLLANNVYPGFKQYLSYMQRILPKTTMDAGVWKFPKGDGYYRHQLKFFTTTDISPEEVHQLGLSETKRIQSEILKILGEQGYPTDGGFSQAIFSLAEDEDRYYPDNASGREQIIADYKTIIAEAFDKIHEVVNNPVIEEVDVRRIPLFKEKDSAGAYYERPALDGSRPGIFYANLYDIKATPKYSMRTLAYHEAVPGHHFQITTANAIEGTPLFRAFVPATAYLEGWALYGERLAYEMGLLPDPIDNVGRLQAELFRAVRLVVDSGIHYKRWTRDEAIDYMYNNTGMAKSDVIAEIERYVVAPGQATAYKIGMSKILELRELAKKSLGDRFDIRDFHDVILLNGPLPLSLVEDHVKEYIKNKSNVNIAKKPRTDKKLL